MKQIFHIFGFLLIPGFACAQPAYIAEEIRPMVEFVRQCETSPADYILGLFETYDVVILGERDHNDTTQYDLIREIISDPRFIDRVGNIMTEVGVYNMAGELNRVLKGSYPNDTTFDTALAETVFNLNYVPVWDKANYSQLWRDVYQVNKNLPQEQKISVFPTEMPFSWDEARGMTAEEYEQSVLTMWDHKDIIMGNNTIHALYGIFSGNDPRKKALIIYNAPHSCLHYKNQDKWRYFAADLIAKRFPGRVANVALNWAVIDDKEGYTGLSNNGKIDAAFAACGYKPVGFDLAGSPIGKYLYDIGAGVIPTGGNSYQDVFHGFIYYKPPVEWVLGIGTPNLDKTDCKEELARRTIIFDGEGEMSEEFMEETFHYYCPVRNYPVTLLLEEERINDQIRQYYRAAQ